MAKLIQTFRPNRADPARVSLYFRHNKKYGTEAKMRPPGTL